MPDRARFTKEGHMTTGVPTQSVSREEWMDALKTLAVEEFDYTPHDAACLRFEDFDVYYESGLTPEESLLAEEGDD